MPIFRQPNHSRDKWKDRPKGLELGRGGSDQDHPQEKEMQKRQNGCLRRPYK